MSIISRVFSQFPKATQELELLPQIEQLANAEDWDGAQRVVTENPALLGDLARALILELASAARQQGNEAVALTLEDYLSLLETARNQGIEQAFREATEFDRTGDSTAQPEQYTDVPPELAEEIQRALAAQALFGIAGQAEDLAEAATCWRGLVRNPVFAGAAPGFRLAAAKSTALVLSRRFEQTGDLADLGEAIDLWHSAVGLSQEDPADNQACLTYLGHSLQTRAVVSPATASGDLDAAIEAYRKGWQQAAARRRAAAAANLANGLHARFRVTSEVDDLDEAVALYAEARRTLPLVARSSAETLSGQADCLLARYRLRGDPGDLDEAISARRLAAQRTPPDSTRLPERLHQFALALTARYDLTHDAGDLNEAITSLQAAIQLAPRGHPDLQLFADSLGECLRRYYASAGLEI